MQYSEIGKIAYYEWFKTFELRPDMNLQLGEFCVMPNHIHGIIIIGDNEFNNNPRRDAMHGVSTESDIEIKPNNCVKNFGNIANKGVIKKYQNKFAPQSKNISSITRGYKSAVTKAARKYDCNFEWQESFYDRIVKSYREYQAVSEYIIENHQNWEKDSLMM